MRKDNNLTDGVSYLCRIHGTGSVFKLKSSFYNELLNMLVSKETLLEYFGILHNRMTTDINFVIFNTHSFAENYTAELHIRINPEDYCKKCGKKLADVNYNGIEKKLGICMEHLR